ncbi:MAG: hypothetical protein ACRDXX_10845 [Stackebrandtia sp.]
MASTLPIPIEFRLPEGWLPGPPDDLGMPDAAFVALHPASRDEDFAAYITVSGHLRHDDVAIRDIADDVFAPMRQFAEVAEISKEIETGTERAPGVTRLAEMTVRMNDHRRDLMQCQVFLTFPDVDDARKRVIMQLMLTATPEQMRQLGGDFEQFVESIEPQQE